MALDTVSANIKIKCTWEHLGNSYCTLLHQFQYVTQWRVEPPGGHATSATCHMLPSVYIVTWRHNSGKVDCNLMRWGKPSSSWKYSYKGMYWSLLLKLSVVVNSLKVTKHFDKVGENPGVVVKYILQWWSKECHCLLKDSNHMVSLRLRVCCLSLFSGSSRSQAFISHISING